jgi:aspartyl-tRNA(Asn)/glutamyl-tRNA(Gln) amidotransferase subunit C
MLQCRPPRLIVYHRGTPKNPHFRAAAAGSRRCRAAHEPTSMSLSPEQVRQVAHLARLKLNPEQVEPYARQLSNILEMVDRLTGTDTASVSPMAHPLDMVQRLRPDVISEANRRDDYQAIAPETADGLYLVPKVIE